MAASARFEKFWSSISNQVGVFAVSHHDTIYAAHRVIENMPPEEWDELYHGDEVNITNCMMVHWTSMNPNNPRDWRDTMSWRRYINPLDPENAPYDGQWVEVNKKPRRYFGGELLKRVHGFDRIIDKDS